MDLTQTILELKENTSKLVERMATQSDKWDQQVQEAVSSLESWKKGFQGSLANASIDVIVLQVDAINGKDENDGLSAPVKTISKVKELIPVISKHSRIQVRMYPGTYEDGGILFPHLSNYVEIVGMGTTPDEVIINENGKIEGYGAARFALRNLKVISNMEEAILVRDGSSAYFEKLKVEAPSGTSAIKIQDGAFARGIDIVTSGGETGIFVARATARFDTISISNANTGLYATVGGNVYRANATYTNVTTPEKADANSIIAP
jgi:hypothetical protein